jgi:hypothetical protein
MINEIQYDKERDEFVALKYRAVAIKPYPNSEEGAFPLHNDDCPYNGESSCFTKSWSSVCGGYGGHAGNYVIRCQEPLKETNGK